MSQALFSSEVSKKIDPEILESKKSVLELFQKQEILRIKNVEEKLNLSEIEIFKVHDQENIPAADIQKLCAVYADGLN
jgi:hypothetical protein